MRIAIGHQRKEEHQPKKVTLQHPNYRSLLGRHPYGNFLYHEKAELVEDR